MSNNAHIRYDPVWRRIKSDDYTRKLEGAYASRFRRLESLNNWGPLNWINLHATATKQAHHLGVERNAIEFLNQDETRSKHRASLRIASHALHWGHLPLSYAGAEEFLRAASIRPETKQILTRIIETVEHEASLDCRERHDYDCSLAILNGDAPFELYRWLSAWLLVRDWKRVWKTVKKIDESHGATPSTLLQEVIRTLVCREDEGYKVLSRCNQADYVLRDLMQCGTAWLTVDSEALWEGNPVGGPGAAQEWALLDAANDYLHDRYYGTPEAALIHSLAAMVVAQGMFLKVRDESDVLSLLTSEDGDYAYRNSMPTYHRERLEDLQSTVSYRNSVAGWQHVGTFDDVCVPLDTRFNTEMHFVTRKGTGLLSYPFWSGHSVIVDPGQWRGGDNSLAV